MVRIALIEDDLSLAQSIEITVRLQPDIYFILHAPSVEDFLDQLPTKAKIDVLFLDIALPGCSGVDALPILRRKLPKTEIIMLSNIEESNIMLQALLHGANGYLNKDFSVMQLPSLIHTFAKGGALLSPNMAKKLISYFHPYKKNIIQQELSPKEEQLLNLFEQGFSYEEAAHVLKLSVDGVRFYVKKIYRKLNVSNKIDAIRIYKKI